MRLRAVLEEAGYTREGVDDALSTEVAGSRDSAELPLYLRLLPEGERLSTLVKLFLLGVAVPEAEAAVALAPLTLDSLHAIGIVARADGEVESPVELVPTDGLIVASDRFRDELERPDHVLGLSPPTRVLASLTTRLPVESALDLGTGNGLQALLAAPHAEHVVAADINPRAVRFAAFNAILNGVQNIEVLEGNLFEPVEGRLFDLIVCNPPYVISPASELVYRDSGLPGDSFCEGLLRRMPRYLAEGGLAFVLLSWLHAPDEDWSAAPLRWVEESGCDAILLRYATHEPLGYAAGWNRPIRPDQAAYAAALDAWLDYYRRLGIEAISWGAAVLRRRNGRNWTFAYQPPHERIVGAAGDHILRLVAAQDRLAGHRSEDDLLDEVLALADDHRVEQTLVLGDGEGTVQSTRLRLDGGLATEVALNGPTVHVLSLLDGRRPLRDVLALAHEEGAAGELSPEEFVAASQKPVRRLLELGFVVPGG